VINGLLLLLCPTPFSVGQWVWFDFPFILASIGRRAQGLRTGVVLDGVFP